MKKYFLRLLSILIFFTVLGEAGATPFRGTAVGSWINVDSQASDHVFVYNQDEWASAIFRWGYPVHYLNNQLFFNGMGGPIGPEWIAEVGDPFLLGQFFYRNEQTFFSSTVNGVDLSIALNLSKPDGLGIHTYFFGFSFLIKNTPNSSSVPELDADIVTISNTSSPAKFNYLGTDYILELLGFSSDDRDTIITEFITPEGAWETAGLYGRISESAPVPEPATIFLLGVGIAGIAGFRVKKRRLWLTS